MDYMDLAVRCSRKAVKLNHSLTHSHCKESWMVWKAPFQLLFILGQIPVILPHGCCVWVLWKVPQQFKSSWPSDVCIFRDLGHHGLGSGLMHIWGQAVILRVQERRNSIALAMELHLSCTNPLIEVFVEELFDWWCWHHELHHHGTYSLP